MENIINAMDTLLSLTGGTTEEIDTIRKQMGLALSKIDQEKGDIEHYIENSKLDVHKGYLAYYQLHCILQKRRSIKIQQSVFNSIWENKNTIRDIKNMRGTIQNIIQRNAIGSYKPRVLLDLDYSKKGWRVEDEKKHDAGECSVN